VDTNKEEIYINSPDNEKVSEQFTGMDFMAVADAVVTDYSSIIYEALLKNLPIYIYCFDSDKYLDERGFYIDFWNDIPAAYSKNAQGIIEEIVYKNSVSAEITEQFKKDYVNNHNYCLHIWKPINQEIPTPPSIMVGLKKEYSQEEINQLNSLIRSGELPKW